MKPHQKQKLIYALVLTALGIIFVVLKEHFKF